MKKNNNTIGSVEKTGGRSLVQEFGPSAVFLVLLFGVAVITSGCVMAIRETPQRPTVGMELLDLQKAKESGAITGAEFEKKRAALLKRD
jgi:hypothetical protein